MNKSEQTLAAEALVRDAAMSNLALILADADLVDHSTRVAIAFLAAKAGLDVIADSVKASL